MEFDGINYIWLGEDKMIKKYKTGGYIKLIEEVDCFKETAASVWLDINPMNKEVFSQYRKRSESTNFFDTWEEAYQYIYTNAVHTVTRKIKELNQAKKDLEIIGIMGEQH